MHLGELLAVVGAADTLHYRDAVVSSVVTDSRKAVEGAVFCALTGEHADGAKFIADAARRGAVAAITERAEQTTPLTQLVVPDARAAMRRAAWALWEPSIRSVGLVGVTGTNGKTTTASLARAMLTESRECCGFIGTTGRDVGNGIEYTGFTTPETAEILQSLDAMRANGMTWAALEVSSHALALGRVDGLRFRVAAFTNLTPDHLDFHKTMDAYLDAKAILFERLEPSAVAVLNRRDPAAARLAARTRSRVVWTGLSGDCDVVVTPLDRATDRGDRYVRLSSPEGTIEFPWAHAGSHNLENLASAAGAALAAGAGLEAVARAARTFAGVPGRLELVANDRGIRVLVDFAHTPDALERVLTSLRSDTRRALICVFGCGGDRDRTKRPVMGRIATDLADAVIVTSDNPRSERPEAIVAEIVVGVADCTHLQVETDRGRAIAMALGMARPGDTVIIAGKGHETHQIIQDRRIPFSDVAVARAVLAPAAA